MPCVSLESLKSCQPKWPKISKETVKKIQIAIFMILGHASFIVPCIAVAGKIPSHVMGHLTIGIGGAMFLSLLCPSPVEKPITTQKEKKEEVFRLFQLIILSTFVLALHVILGACNMTGHISAKATGWGILGPWLGAIFLIPVTIPCWPKDSPVSDAN